MQTQLLATNSSTEQKSDNLEYEIQSNNDHDPGVGGHVVPTITARPITIAYNPRPSDRHISRVLYLDRQAAARYADKLRETGSIATAVGFAVSALPAPYNAIFGAGTVLYNEQKNYQANAIMALLVNPDNKWIKVTYSGRYTLTFHSVSVSSKTSSTRVDREDATIRAWSYGTSVTYY